MEAQKFQTAEERLIKAAADSLNEGENDCAHSHLVSFLSEVPEPLQAAMAAFVDDHPNWDQYRLIQAALAGFLVQNGVDSRSVTRLYLDNMFSHKSFVKDL